MASGGCVLFALGGMLWLAGLIAASVAAPSLVPAFLVGMVPWLLVVVVAAEVVTRPRR